MKLIKKEHKNMFNIYNQNISKFQAISKHEDYNKNLQKFLLNNFSWKNKVVFEAGVGSGRLTDYYIEYVKKIIVTDNSDNMLNYCKNKYNEIEKINYINLPHIKLKKLKEIKADIFISSYSLSCEIINENKSVEKIYDELMQGIYNVTKKDGLIIIIENKQIFENLPSYDYRMEKYFSLLNDDFNHIEVQTNYLFDSINEAYEVLNDFFGPEIAEKVKKHNSCEIPEKAGVWYKYLTHNKLD